METYGTQSRQCDAVSIIVHRYVRASSRPDIRKKTHTHTKKKTTCQTISFLRSKSSDDWTHFNLIRIGKHNVFCMRG